MAVVSKALLRRRLNRSHWHSLLLPRAFSSFVVDDGTEVHRGDATVAHHPTTRALRPTRGISIGSVRCLLIGQWYINASKIDLHSAASVRWRWRNASGGRKHANDDGGWPRGNFAETPVAVVFRMEDAYLAVGLQGNLAFAGSEVVSRTWFCQFTIDILFWRLLF